MIFIHVSSIISRTVRHRFKAFKPTHGRGPSTDCRAMFASLLSLVWESWLVNYSILGEARGIILF